MAAGKKTGGRKAGTPNKRTQDVIERLEALDCDPLAGMVFVAKEAVNQGDFGLAGAMFKELAQYVYPKRKSIEHSLPQGETEEIFINFKPTGGIENGARSEAR